MSPVELNRILKSGIDAVKRGQKQKGRELLLKVIAADERSEDGWFWLSMAVDDPQDKATALENVLTLNPANMTAQANLKWLKKNTPAQTAGGRTRTDNTGSGREAKSATPFAPLSPVENISAIDDPYQCIYCGALAKREDRRCPECKRNLIAKRIRSKSRSYALRTAIFAVSIQFGIAGIEAMVDGSIAAEGRNGFIRYLFTALKLVQCLRRLFDLAAALGSHFARGRFGAGIDFFAGDCRVDGACEFGLLRLHCRDGRRHRLVAIPLDTQFPRPVCRRVLHYRRCGRAGVDLRRRSRF